MDTFKELSAAKKAAVLIVGTAIAILVQALGILNSLPF